MIAPRDTLIGVLALTKECGFERAVIRPWQSGDIAVPQMDQNWYVLDAGEDAVPRHGPTVCFLNMVQGPLMKSGKGN